MFSMVRCFVLCTTSTQGCQHALLRLLALCRAFYVGCAQDPKSPTRAAWCMAQDAQVCSAKKFLKPQKQRRSICCILDTCLCELLEAAERLVNELVQAGSPVLGITIQAGLHNFFRRSSAETRTV